MENKKTTIQTTLSTSAISLISVGLRLVSSGRPEGACLIALGAVVSFIKYWLRSEQ